MLGGPQGTGPSHHRSGDSLTPRRLGERERWPGVCARPGRRSHPSGRRGLDGRPLAQPQSRTGLSAVARSLGDKGDRQLADAARDRLADEATSRARCRPAHLGEAIERATSVLCVGKLGVSPLRSRALLSAISRVIPGRAADALAVARRGRFCPIPVALRQPYADARTAHFVAFRSCDGASLGGSKRASRRGCSSLLSPRRGGVSAPFGETESIRVVERCWLRCDGRS